MRIFKITFYTIAVFTFSLVIASGCGYRDQKDTLFQVSTINALMEGVLDGGIAFQALKQHGDFGIGTFEGLNGEMVALDGKFYQVKADGKAYPVNDNAKTPFADVKFFKADKSFYINEEMNFEQLRARILQEMKSSNLFYAVKVKGEFKYVKTRSVPKQEKPYLSLTEAVKSQKVFEFHDCLGTAEGFYFPEYVKGVNMPGLHLHFLNDNQDAGGHVLECVVKGVNIEIDEANEFNMNLPLNNDFSKADFSKDIQAALEKAEK